VGEAGLLVVCAGCCCGQPGPGGPKTPPRALRAEVRRAHRSAGLAGTVRLLSTACLGPCSEANVALLLLGGRMLWFRRMGSATLFTALLDHVRAALAEPDRPLPPALAARAFAWAGGGRGPAPPVEGEPPAGGDAGDAPAPGAGGRP
jgi:cobaltochelatase CobN